MKHIFLTTLILGLTFNLWSQKKVTISGHINNESGEELIGATVYVKNSKIGTATNAYGFYSITLPERNYEIEYSYIAMRMK